MRFIWPAATFVILLTLHACGVSRPTGSEKREITVAAASNLAEAFAEIEKAFSKETGIKVTLSFAATAQLAHQIENGAPFDVFAAADTEHIDGLIRKGLLTAESRALYGRGQLALWIPKGDKFPVVQLADVVDPKIRFIAIATPSLAPYGQAAIEALRKSGLWTTVESKVVYAPNIGVAKQLAASGNADVAFTAYPLVRQETGRTILIDSRLHSPLNQAMAIASASAHPVFAKQFRD